MKTGFSLWEKVHRENPVFITGMGLQCISKKNSCRGNYMIKYGNLKQMLSASLLSLLLRIKTLSFQSVELRTYKALYEASFELVVRDYLFSVVSSC